MSSCVHKFNLSTDFWGTSSMESMAGQTFMGHLPLAMPADVFLCLCTTVDHQCQSLIQNSHQSCLFECRCTLTSVFFISGQVTNCPTSNLDFKNWPVGSLHNCTSFSLVWEATDLCVCVSGVYRNRILTAEILREVWSWYASPCHELNSQVSLKALPEICSFT